ncbi:MAG TPA: hypothetical protein VM554_02570 [Acidisarcina sp.]|nr:hypothetical protein [Acidisarcina sp.]
MPLKVSIGRTPHPGARHLLSAVLFASLLPGISLPAQQLSAQQIVQRSIEPNNKDWDSAQDYDYFQRKRDGGTTRTYDVIMLEGSRYYRLVAIDDRPLSPEDQAREKHNFAAAIAQRKQETAKAREQRIGQYQKDRERYHVLMGELTNAFDFTLSGEQMLGSHRVYVLKGKPRRGYHPPNKLAKALTGMQGTLWIDAADFHWVKGEVEVVHPVWIGGLIARVDPGTRFELAQDPIADGVWMPSHFSMETRATVLLLFSRSQREDSTYFSYHKPGTMPEDK